MRTTHYPGAIGSAVLIAIFCFLFAPDGTAASSLPGFGFALSSEADAADYADVASGTGIKNALVMLPPILLNLDPGENQENADLERGSYSSRMPAGFHFYARLKIRFGEYTQKGKELEDAVGSRVEDALARLSLGDPAIEGLVVEIEEPIASIDLAQFALADIAVKSKVHKGSLTAVLAFPENFIEKHGVLIQRMASYYDMLSPVWTQGWRETQSWIRDRALNKSVILRMESTSENLVSAYLDAVLSVAESPVDSLVVAPRSLQDFRSLCSVAAFTSRYLTDDFIATAPREHSFSVTVDGMAPEEYKFFSNAMSQDAGFLVKAGTDEKPATIYLHIPSGEPFETEWYDAVSGEKLEPGEPVAETTGTAQDGVSGSAYTLIMLRSPKSSERRLHSSVQVYAKADLTVEEIIARWQQYREAQDQRLSNYISDCFMTLHFETTALSASGFDISMQFRQFRSREGFVDWVQTDFYLNGVKFKKGQEFPLPQLEPEKVVSQPLELKLDEKYEYKLLGTDRVDDALCYVVGIEPKVSDAVLYSGRVWIDGATFRHVKMELNQKGAKGNITSNMETQHYELVPDGKGNEFNLKRFIYAQQTLNAAGRSFILQKTYKFANYRMNTADFEQALAAAHLSESPIYRDTEKGLNILKKEGDERILVEAGKRVKSIVGGVLYDGSFDFPIPLAGLSLVDFDYRKTGSQLSVFFAGPVLAANLSKQWSDNFRMGWDVALSALPQNNRIYSGADEVKNQSFYKFEEATGIIANWQATLNLSLTGGFHVSYNLFRATGDTDEDFRLPRNGFTLTPSFELKYAREGYTFKAGGSLTNRIHWKEFGPADGPREPTRNQFDKYYAEFGKDFFFGKFTEAGIHLSYYGGDKLDRISRYTTSFIGEPKIKGVPSGTDSFDAVGVASVYHGINILEFIKFEGSYSHAWARNREESRHFNQYDGLQFDFGFAGPWSTYVQGTLTYAINGNLDRYNSRVGAYLIFYKPLN
jgi:hypothetical protein